MKSDKSRGLGDSIEKFTEATGLKRLAKRLIGEDCGCDERRDKLNKLFPYARPMNAEEREVWETELSDWENHRGITAPMQKKAIELLRQTTGQKKRFSRCGSCVSDLFKKVESIYHNSCDED